MQEDDKSAFGGDHGDYTVWGSPGIKPGTVPSIPSLFVRFVLVVVAVALAIEVFSAFTS